MSVAVPAILPSSRADLKEKLARFTQSASVERIQIDIVDGKFASPASWPYTAPNEIRAMMDLGEMLPRPDRISYEMDLMCLDVEEAAETWLTFGANRLTFHAESIKDLPAFIAFAHKRYGPGSDFATGIVAFGVAVNLETDLALIEPVVKDVSYVQCMGIASIGKQGQPFDERVFEKIKKFKTAHPEVPVQVDGGVSLETAPTLIALGVENLVVGSAITRVHNVGAALAEFEKLTNPFGV